MIGARAVCVPAAIDALAQVPSASSQTRTTAVLRVSVIKPFKEIVVPPTYAASIIASVWESKLYDGAPSSTVEPYHAVQSLCCPYASLARRRYKTSVTPLARVTGQLQRVATAAPHDTWVGVERRFVVYCSSTIGIAEASFTVPLNRVSPRRTLDWTSGANRAGASVSMATAALSHSSVRARLIADAVASSVIRTSSLAILVVLVRSLLEDCALFGSIRPRNVSVVVERAAIGLMRMRW